MPERYRDQARTRMEVLEAGGEPHIIGKIMETNGLRKDGNEISIELALSTWQSGEKMFFTVFYNRKYSIHHNIFFN